MSLQENEAFRVLREAVVAGANERCRQKAIQLRQRLFEPQLALVDDPERHKAVLCPRRAGKSYGLAVYMYITMLERPNANVVYVARTRDKAKEILWDTAETSLKKLNKDFELGMEFSEVHTSVRAPNGSRLRLRGCETHADIEQYRGEPFHLVVIDECASFSPGVLDQLINRGIEPTLGDFLGTLVMSGTPGAILAGPFYRATSDKAFNVEGGRSMSRPYVERSSPRWDLVDYSWSFHTWTRRDNIRLPHLWDEAERVRRLNGWSEQNPTWLREYMGRWIQDDAHLVYRFHPERNIWTPGKRTNANPFGLPTDHEWKYVAGMDFGTKDPFALQVVAYSDTDHRIYQCYELVEKGLLPPDFAARIKALPVQPEWMVGDFGPFGEMLQQQMLQEYGLPIEKANKKDKRDHIELLNGDLLDGRCFLLDGSEASKQMLQLSWDDTGLKERVGGGNRNDAADAMVYTWRRLYHHYAESPAAPPPEPGTPEHEEALDAREVAEVVERDRKEQDAYDRYADDFDFYEDRDFAW